jgi:alpha-glucosidase (family GH31 glycosyl hydrolase)
MLGSHLMASLVVSPSERVKKTFFPNERFFDFENGKLMNLSGENYVTVEAGLDKLPLFVREGFITPIQEPNKTIKNVMEMRKLPVELLIAIDRDFRAAGRIYLDDGKCKKLFKKIS